MLIFVVAVLSSKVAFTLLMFDIKVNSDIFVNYGQLKNIKSSIL